MEQWKDGKTVCDFVLEAHPRITGRIEAFADTPEEEAVMKERYRQRFEAFCKALADLAEEQVLIIDLKDKASKMMITHLGRAHGDDGPRLN